MSGTHENQCIRPCKCGLLHTSRPLLARRRVKKVSISGGQQRDVTALKPAASSVAVAPSVPLGAGVAAGGACVGASVGAGVAGDSSITDWILSLPVNRLPLGTSKMPGPSYSPSTLLPSS